MQPADERLGLPPWKAIPPSSKNTDHGIGAGCPFGSRDSWLLWSCSLRYTRREWPIGVSLPLPPEEIFTGPRMTLPSLISQAFCDSRSTQAFAVVMQGVPAASGVWWEATTAAGSEAPSANAGAARMPPATASSPRAPVAATATRRMLARWLLIIYVPFRAALTAPQRTGTSRSGPAFSRHDA